MFRPTARPRLFCDKIPFPECIAQLADGSLLVTCGGKRYNEPGPILRVSAEGEVFGIFADPAVPVSRGCRAPRRRRDRLRCDRRRSCSLRRFGSGSRRGVGGRGLEAAQAERRGP